jgi:HSP20 family molecular chaperone IbpA
MRTILPRRKTLKVESQDIQNSQKRLANLKRRQGELVKAKEVEIKQIKESYNAEARYARQSGLEKVDQQRFNNQALLDKSIIQKNEKLEEVRDSIMSTQEFLAEEEKKLKETSKLQQSSIRQSGQERISELKYQAFTASEKSNQELNESLGQIKEQSDRAITESEQEAKQRQKESDASINIKVSNNQIKNERTLHGIHETANQQQDALHKTYQEELKLQKEKQDTQRVDLDKIHLDKMKTTSSHQQDSLIMKQESFKEKFAHMTDEHKAVIDRLTKAFDKQVNDISMAHHEKVSLAQTKANDSFYRNKLIEPQITEDATSYTLSLNIPEHEKDQFVISAHKRNIKLSFFRNYDDSVYEQAGTKHSTKRTESLTRTFDVAAIVDPNKVTKTYQDNMLSFKIAKA